MAGRPSDATTEHLIGVSSTYPPSLAPLGFVYRKTGTFARPPPWPGRKNTRSFVLAAVGLSLGWSPTYSAPESVSGWWRRTDFSSDRINFSSCGASLSALALLINEKRVVVLPFLVVVVTFLK